MNVSAAPATQKFAFIDCIRGYAVLMVITFHTTLLFRELPYPMRRFVYLGWLGVHLFFVASAVTLMLSLEQERARTGGFSARAFFIRRWMRIAPAFYLAGLLYNLIWPPENLPYYSVLSSLFFVNAWHPETVAAVWGISAMVPGGWSIGVEFTFYFLFPLVAAWIRTPAQAVALFLSCVLVALVANPLARDFFTPIYEARWAEQFVIWWPPNQMPVFALGILVYFPVSSLIHARPGSHPSALAAWKTPLLIMSLLAFAGLSAVPTPRYISAATFLPPAEILAGVIFALFTLALAIPGPSLFVNGAAQALGKVSFSAYLSHFAVLRILPERYPDLFHTNAVGYVAIGAFVLATAIVTAVTFAISWCCYRWLEQPAIRLGQQLANPRRIAVAQNAG